MTHPLRPPRSHRVRLRLPLPLEAIVSFSLKTIVSLFSLEGPVSLSLENHRVFLFSVTTPFPGPTSTPSFSAASTPPFPLMYASPSSIELLIELAGTEQGFLRRQIVGVVGAMLQVAQAEALEDSVLGSVSVLNLVEVVMGSIDSSSIGNGSGDYFHALSQQSFPQYKGLFVMIASKSA